MEPAPGGERRTNHLTLNLAVSLLQMSLCVGGYHLSILGEQPCIRTYLGSCIKSYMIKTWNSEAIKNLNVRNILTLIWQ